VIGVYEARAAAHASARDAQAVLSRRIARARLATAIPGGCLLIWALSRGAPALPMVAAVLLLSVFAALVVWHARVDDRMQWLDALATFNLQAIARIARAWDRLPPAEMPRFVLPRPVDAGAAAVSSDSPPIEVEHHPYALDLDLFGRASLMQWLGPAATVAGTETLHAWLLSPAADTAVRDRQQAVVELAGADEWREQFAAHGQLAAGVRATEVAVFLQWAEGNAPLPASRLRLLRALSILLPLAIWVLLAMQIVGALDGGYWLIPVVLGMVMTFAYALPIHASFTRAGSGQQAFSRYASLFDHATTVPGSAGYIRGIQSRFTGGGASAPDCMRRLNRILGYAELRSGAGIFHFLVQAMTLWDFHVFFALERWRREVGPRVREWLRALGELDALTVFARVKADNPAWCMPEIAAMPPAQRTFAAKDLGHPLIHHERRVANDVEVGPPGTLVLITGSNMSGKSTLLRAIGLNTVLAQAGAPVCATSLRLPPVDLETSIRVQDSLEHGLSYFMAALARLKGVVDRAQQPGGPTVLYLLDEILQGTNTVERALAVRGIARRLLKSDALGVMTTHDLGLAGEEPLDSAARLAHFTEIVDADGGMTFDYRLRPGLATSRNALRLMHLIGIDLEAPNL
jgi:hypothetical protein